MRNVGEKVEWISQEDTLNVGDCFHARDVGVDLCLLLDVIGVIDGDTVEEVHEDDHDEEDEGEEEKMSA